MSLRRGLSRLIKRSPSRDDRPLLILHYNPDWYTLGEAGPICGGVGGCELSYDRARFDEADAVIFHIPSLHPFPELSKRPGQRWVALSMESDVNYPQLRDPTFMARFDLTMTYRLDSNVPILYLDDDIVAAMRTPPQPKTEPAPVVYFASNRNDRVRREFFVRELTEYIAVDCYGRSLKNRELAVDRGRETKLATIARYKFTLAFENSFSRDYVTEKFFDPLVAGSVPVYRGAPNVTDFAPAPHSYIDANDFTSPAELAAYLRALAEDETRYAEYLAWKAHGPDERFQRFYARWSEQAICRLCARLRAV